MQASKWNVDLIKAEEKIAKYTCMRSGGRRRFNTKIDIRGKLPGSIALSSAVTWPAISDKLTGKHGIDFSTAKLGFCGVSPPTLDRLAFGSARGKGSKSRRNKSM